MDNNLIMSLDRGLEIIEILAENPEPMGATTVGKMLRVDKSTAYRLLRTLLGRGFVTQLENGKYGLGSRCIQIGAAAVDRVNMQEQAMPFLRDLSNLTGLTANLAALVDRKAIHTAKIQGTSILSVSTQVGMEAPPHCSASGKILVAFLPSEIIRTMVGAQSFKRYTANTITDFDEFEKHLKLVRERGYAEDNEERYLGVWCCAAPIYNHHGEVVFSLGISSPSSNADTSRKVEVRKAVIETAARASKHLGYVPPLLKP